MAAVYDQPIPDDLNAHALIEAGKRYGVRIRANLDGNTVNIDGPDEAFKWFMLLEYERNLRVANLAARAINALGLDASIWRLKSD